MVLGKIRESRAQCKLSEQRVLPGAKTNAGGKGPGLRYRQPQNLSYHSAGLPRKRSWGPAFM